MAYFSNSSEGDVLDRQCFDCRIGEMECPILLVQVEYNYDQIGIPKLRECLNFLVDSSWKCRMKLLIDELKANNFTGKRNE